MGFRKHEKCKTTPCIKKSRNKINDMTVPGFDTSETPESTGKSLQRRDSGGERAGAQAGSGTVLPAGHPPDREAPFPAARHGAVALVRNIPYYATSTLAHERAMADPTETVSKITAKGQTTVPKEVRRALGVDYGGRIAYRIEQGRVTLRRAEVEHRDPALRGFLKLIADDIAKGRNVKDLQRALHKALKQGKVDLDAPIEGEVDL